MKIPHEVGKGRKSLASKQLEEGRINFIKNNKNKKSIKSITLRGNIINDIESKENSR